MKELKGIHINGVNYPNIVDFTEGRTFDIKAYKSEDAYEYKLGFTNGKEEQNIIFVFDDIDTLAKICNIFDSLCEMMEQDEDEKIAQEVIYNAENIIYLNDVKKILSKYNIKECLKNLDKENDI